MSSFVPISGTLLSPTCVRLTGTSITDIFTADDNFDTVFAVYLTNETAGAVTCLVDWFDGTTNNHIHNASVVANGVSSYEHPIKMVNAQKIRATAGTGNAITVTVHRVKAQR